MPAPLPRLNLLKAWQPRSKLGKELLRVEPLAAMLERGSAPELGARLLDLQDDLSFAESRDLVLKTMQSVIGLDHGLRHVSLPRSHWLQWLAKQGHFSWLFEDAAWSEGEFRSPQSLASVMWRLRAPDGSSLQFALKSSQILTGDQGELTRRSLARLPLFACVSSDSKLVMPAEGEVWLHAGELPPQRYRVVAGLSLGADGQLESVASNTQSARKLVFAFVQRE